VADREAVAAPAAAPVSTRARSFLLVIAATLCWSTSGFFITTVVRNSNLTAVALAFWRDLATFLTLLVALLAIRPGVLRVKRRDVPWLAAMGAISIGLFHVAWNSAVLLIGASITTVFQGNSPLIVAVLAWFIWRERLTGRKWLAIILGIAGTVLIAGLPGLTGPAASGNVEITPAGLGLGFIVAGAYATLTLFGKKLVGDYNAWTVLTYTFGFAALALLPLQIGRPLPGPVTVDFILPFAALVLVTTVGGFGLYTLGLRGLNASTAAIVGLAEIPFAAILAYILLGERLTVAQIVGAALVAAGVVIISRRRA
jgi:drug/metabolite transporter (DMT)-like permease